MKAIILAAGKGERLRPLTENMPKPMVPIAGKPVLEYLINLCKRHGINEIAINTSYLPEKIKEYFGDGSKFGVKLHFSFEPELLGTSGALNNFRNLFKDEPFFVIYGDNLTNINLTEMRKKHQITGAFATMYLYHEKMADSKTTPGCVIINEKDQVVSMIENPDEKQKEMIKGLNDNQKFTNGGIYLLNQKVLDMIPQGFSDFAKQIIPQILIEEKKVIGYTENCYTREVGQMHRYLKAKEEIESGKIKLNP